MRDFISSEGAVELKSLRVGGAPDATGGLAPVRLIARCPSEECGCPEELWIVDGVEMLIHIEPDGRGDVLLFLGDEEVERTFECAGLADLRAKAFGWLASFRSDD